MLAGCAEPSRPISLQIEESASPAGADSGQPNVASAGDAVLMSWLGRSRAGGRQLLFSTYFEGTWSEPTVIAERDRFLVNVADFPSVTSGPGGTLWAHWLERDAAGFGYGVRVTHSVDQGESWSDSWVPHDDGSATEHGFVSMVPVDGRMGLIWLDGRGYAEGVDGTPPTLETALFFRTTDAAGGASEEQSLDARVCDCCQTDVAETAEGPVLVYRDRSPEEIRDIRVMRRVDGVWSDAGLVHEDGWETGACPINGPAIAARGRRAAVVWFTAADPAPRVQVAFSDNSGRDFDPPTRVDDGAPAGRVDLVLLSDGSALVSWVERTGNGGAEVRLRRVSPDGDLLEGLSATASFSERAGGFPRLAQAGDGAIILAWTDGEGLRPRVRVTRIELEES